MSDGSLLLLVGCLSPAQGRAEIGHRLKPVSPAGRLEAGPPLAESFVTPADAGIRERIFGEVHPHPA